MGKYVKVYLNQEDVDALEELQEWLKGQQANAAMNHILKSGIHFQAVRAGIREPKYTVYDKADEQREDAGAAPVSRIRRRRRGVE